MLVMFPTGQMQSRMRNELQKVGLEARSPWTPCTEHVCSTSQRLKHFRCSLATPSSSLTSSHSCPRITSTGWCACGMLPGNCCAPPAGRLPSASEHRGHRCQGQRLLAGDTQGLSQALLEELRRRSLPDFPGHSQEADATEGHAARHPQGAQGLESRGAAHCCRPQAALREARQAGEGDDHHHVHQEGSQGHQRGRCASSLGPQQDLAHRPWRFRSKPRELHRQGRAQTDVPTPCRSLSSSGKGFECI